MKFPKLPTKAIYGFVIGFAVLMVIFNIHGWIEWQNFYWMYEIADNATVEEWRVIETGYIFGVILWSLVALVNFKLWKKNRGKAYW